VSKHPMWYGLKFSSEYPNTQQKSVQVPAYFPLSALRALSDVQPLLQSRLPYTPGGFLQFGGDCRGLERFGRDQIPNRLKSLSVSPNLIPLWRGLTKQALKRLYDSIHHNCMHLNMKGMCCAIDDYS